MDDWFFDRVIPAFLAFLIVVVVVLLASAYGDLVALQEVIYR